MPANAAAWETYWRVWDQIDVWPTKEKDKQHVALRTEAVIAAIKLTSSPLVGEDRGEGDHLAEIYDRVMMIHNIRHGQYSPDNA